MEKVVLPRFLIIGAQKCGTTWLHRHLAGHPELFLPEGKDDEFFSYQPVRSLEYYQRKFAAAPKGTVCGDSCASYLWSPHPDDCQPENFNPAIPETVRDALGADCRLIVLLKDPVVRTLSAYLHHIAHGSLDPNSTLFNAPRHLGLIALSRYGWHLRHWLATFPPEQLLVVPGPGGTDAQAVLRRVMAFLGVTDQHSFNDAERVIYGGLSRRLDDSGLWVTVGQQGLNSLEMIRRPCPILERDIEVRLVDPVEIAQLRAMLGADTADFAVLAEAHRWIDPAFSRWQSWPSTVVEPVISGVFATGQPTVTPSTPSHRLCKIRVLADRTARFLYRRLPLPLSVKGRIRSFLYRYLGSLPKGGADPQRRIQTTDIHPATVRALALQRIAPPCPAPPMMNIDPEGADKVPDNSILNTSIDAPAVLSPTCHNRGSE